MADCNLYRPTIDVTQMQKQLFWAAIAITWAHLELHDIVHAVHVKPDRDPYMYDTRTSNREKL